MTVIDGAGVLHNPDFTREPLFTKERQGPEVMLAPQAEHTRQNVSFPKDGPITSAVDGNPLHRGRPPVYRSYQVSGI